MEQEQPIIGFQVFSQQALTNAAATLAEMNHERQPSGVRILEQARVNKGVRSLPDAAQSVLNLKSKKTGLAYCEGQKIQQIAR